MSRAVSLWRGCLVPATQSMSYLHSGLREVHPTCKIFSYKSIRVMGPLEDALQGLQLAAIEGCPVSPLLSLLLLLRVQLIIWKESGDKEGQSLERSQAACIYCHLWEIAKYQGQMPFSARAKTPPQCWGLIIARLFKIRPEMVAWRMLLAAHWVLFCDRQLKENLTRPNPPHFTRDGERKVDLILPHSLTLYDVYLHSFIAKYTSSSPHHRHTVTSAQCTEKKRSKPNQRGFHFKTSSP